METKTLWDGSTDYQHDSMVEKFFRRKTLGLHKLPIVYCWYCTKTNRVYIGQTTNLPERIKQYLKAFLWKTWKEHKQNPELVADARKYGLKNFMFGILFQGKSRVMGNKKLVDRVFNISGSPISLNELEYTTIEYSKTTKNLNLYNVREEEGVVHQQLLSCLDNNLVPYKLDCRGVPKAEKGLKEPLAK